MPVSFRALMKRHTERAVLITYGGTDMWLPRSQTISPTEFTREMWDATVPFTITDWIAREKGIVGDRQARHVPPTPPTVRAIAVDELTEEDLERYREVEEGVGLNTTDRWPVVDQRGRIVGYGIDKYHATKIAAALNLTKDPFSEDF